MTFCDKWLFWPFWKWIKKSCVLCGNFISIYKINRTLHGCLGIRILSSHPESISHSFASITRERYFHHSKIKFVSPRGHVISSIYSSKKRYLVKILDLTSCYRTQGKTEQRICSKFQVFMTKLKRIKPAVSNNSGVFHWAN